MRLCKDCKHLSGVMCKRPTMAIDPVQGKRYFPTYHALAERYTANLCGITARYFEPRLTLWQRIENWLESSPLGCR